LTADEISALVLDPGTSWTRAGFAGEDTPKAVIPTDYGVTPDGKLHFGDNDVHTVRPGMEIRNPMKDGVGMFHLICRVYQMYLILTVRISGGLGCSTTNLEIRSNKSAYIRSQ